MNVVKQTSCVYSGDDEVDESLSDRDDPVHVSGQGIGEWNKGIGECFAW